MHPAPSAASRRISGYPVQAADSRPALQRDWKAPVELANLQGPEKLPRLPEVARRRRSRSRRRRSLQQQIGAAVIPPEVAAAHAAKIATAAGAGGSSDGLDRTSSAAAGQSTACAAGPGCFTPRGGFSGLDAPPAGTMGLAVGKQHVVQVAGGVMTVFNLGGTGMKSTVVRTVSLQKFFAAVAPSCEGAHDGAALYDKHAGRFVVAASCGGFGRILVGVSATGSAVGTWYQFGLIADAVNTPLECKAPKEQALADYPQLGYNKDGLFVSYFSYCPSNPDVAGASVLALPKYKAYQGSPSMYYAVYTAADVAASAQLLGGAASVRQLQPVVPQSAADVQEGITYFVTDNLPRPGAKRSNFTLVALTNTGALWGYAADVNGVPAPTLVATTVPWGRSAPITADAVLRQPGDAAELPAGGNKPPGFWSGGAVMSKNKIMLTTRADVTEESGRYNPRPGVIWAEVEPSVKWETAQGNFNETKFTVPAEECSSAVQSGMAPTFDWSKDFSLTYGSEFAKNWSWSLNAYRAASAIKTKAPKDAMRAAAVVLDRASRLEEAAKTSPAANFQVMGFPQGTAAAGGRGGGGGGPLGSGRYRGRNNNCGCENSCGYNDVSTYNYVYNFDDYCDAGSNQWGPETGNDMFGSTYNGAYCTGDSTFGLVGNHQYDECWRFCLIRCSPRNGGVGGSVNAGYGFYGATNFYPSFFYASVKDGTSPAAVRPAVLPPATEGKAAQPTQPMKAAACASRVSLGAVVLRAGWVDPGAALGLAFPAVAVASNGAAVLAFTYAGPGKTADDMADAYPGVGAAFIDGRAAGSVPMSTLQRSSSPIALADTGGALTWGELSAADVHPVTGTVYVAVRRGGQTRTGRAHVATWVGVIPMTVN